MVEVNFRIELGEKKLISVWSDEDTICWYNIDTFEK